MGKKNSVESPTGAPPGTFQYLLNSYLQGLASTVLDVKARPNASQHHGPAGMYILVSEALSLASTRVGGQEISSLYTVAAAYCLAAAMLASGDWLAPIYIPPTEKEDTDVGDIDAQGG